MKDAILKRYEKTVIEQRKLQLNLRQQNVALGKQRDFLLPRLISGEIDVSDALLPAAEAAE